MAQLHCESNDDCAAGIRMICEHKKCTCRHGELFIDYRNFGCFVKGLCYYSFLIYIFFISSKSKRKRNMKRAKADP